MVLIFSKVQRFNRLGKCYRYKEELDVPQDVAEQYVAANVAGYVVEKQPEPVKVEKPEEIPPSYLGPEDQPAAPEQPKQSPQKRG